MKFFPSLVTAAVSAVGAGTAIFYVIKSEASKCNKTTDFFLKQLKQ
jgi:hypothetical protein